MGELALATCCFGVGRDDELAAGKGHLHGPDGEMVS